MSGDHAGVTWDLSSDDRELGRDLQKRLTFQDKTRSADAAKHHSSRANDVSTSGARKSNSRKVPAPSEMSGPPHSSPGSRSRKSRSPSAGSHHNFRPGQQQPWVNKNLPHKSSCSSCIFFLSLKLIMCTSVMRSIHICHNIFVNVTSHIYKYVESSHNGCGLCARSDCG